MSTEKRKRARKVANPAEELEARAKAEARTEAQGEVKVYFFGHYGHLYKGLISQDSKCLYKKEVYEGCKFSNGTGNCSLPMDARFQYDGKIQYGCKCIHKHLLSMLKHHTGCFDHDKAEKRCTEFLLENEDNLHARLVRKNK